MVTNFASGCSNTATITIQIRDVQADFNIVPQAGCSPYNFCINNSSVDAVTYNWLIWNVANNVGYFSELPQIHVQHCNCLVFIVFD